MRSLHLFSLPLLALTAAAASSTQQDPPPPSNNKNVNIKNLYSSPNEAFQELLNALPEESIHAALVNSLTHFREGIFESDRHGVEHIHQDNPPLATKLIVAAVQDLKQKRAFDKLALDKRQVTNGTTTTAAGTTTQPAADPSTTTKTATSAVLVPVTITTTNSQGKVTTNSVDVLSDPTASVTVTATTTNSRGQTTTVTTAKPAVVISTTNAAGQTTQVTSAVDFAPTSGEVLTTTNAAGSTMVTTYTPDGGKVSSIVLKTTTGDDGKPTVVTSYTYVQPAGATAAETSSGSKTTAGKPGLQSGAAVGAVGVERAVVGFGLGVFGLLMG